MGVNFGQLLKKQQENEVALSGKGFLKMQSGKNKIRVLPPWKILDGAGASILVKTIEDVAKGTGVPFLEIYTHFQLGSDQKKTMVCLKQQYDQPCAICEAIELLRTSPQIGDRNRGDNIKAKARFMYNVLAYARTTTSDGRLEFSSTEGSVQVMIVGRKIHQQIISIMLDNEYGDITDPINGFDITVEKKGSGTKDDTDYSTLPSRNPTQVNAAYIAELKNLDEYLTAATPEEIEGYVSEFAHLRGNPAQAQIPAQAPVQQAIPQGIPQPQAPPAPVGPAIPYQLVQSPAPVPQAPPAPVQQAAPPAPVQETVPQAPTAPVPQAAPPAPVQQQMPQPAQQAAPPVPVAPQAPIPTPPAQQRAPIQGS